MVVQERKERGRKQRGRDRGDVEVSCKDHWDADEEQEWLERRP